MWKEGEQFLGCCSLMVSSQGLEESELFFCYKYMEQFMCKVVVNIFSVVSFLPVK